MMRGVLRWGGHGVSSGQGASADAASAAAVALALIAVVVVTAALSQARIFAIPTVLAGLVAVSLAPVARACERIGAQRAATAFVLVFGGLGALAAVAYVLAPRFEALASEAPDIVRRLEYIVRRFEAEMAQLGGAPSSGEGGDESGSLVESGRRLVTDTAMATPALVGAAAYCVFLTFFLLAERSRIARLVLWSAQRTATRRALGRAMRDVRLQVSTYLFAITIVNICLGVATAAAFWALDVPNAMLWGAAMTLFNYMPYLGPVLVNAAVFTVQLTNTLSVDAALAPVAALALLNTIEGYWLTPGLIGRQVKVSALAIFLAIAFGAWLWGAAGALIATPALIFLRAFALRLAAGPQKRAPLERATRESRRHKS
ncbi:AI-2E family transporter [Rubrimonas cliftonensis]|uniref:Predicted PurR-regulated permease PerM n=1 Tax=Rubrimonas cliftonensis TaxID=89524 RepID=A0A1H4CH13_9RHOB|nr:AI-2E family transporter [Rubrimonas cliftonensis]SEA59630.1 Predicted PurR-regulated permease PerM [Rubrimonas cliftonensis]